MDKIGLKIKISMGEGCPFTEVCRDRKIKEVGELYAFYGEAESYNGGEVR